MTFRPSHRADAELLCAQDGRGVFRTSHSLLHRDDSTPICVLGALPRAVQRVARRVGRPSVVTAEARARILRRPVRLRVT